MQENTDGREAMRRAETAVRFALESETVGQRMVEIVRLYESGAPDERRALISVLATHVALGTRNSALTRA